MHYIDVFNGDADGICALLQLRQSEPHDAKLDARLVTGVKRDIGLLARVEARPGDLVTVLDISLDKNREGLVRILESGARVRYYDHHRASDIPEHEHFVATIDTAPDVCTSLLVDRALRGAKRAWAVVGAFGDNMEASAHAAAVDLGLDSSELLGLRELGRCINYNAYGRVVEDLHFAPDALYRRLLPYADPLEFIAQDEAFETLREAFAEDVARANQLVPVEENPGHAVYVLPDEAWAARVSGVFANQLASASPSRAHALLTERASGSYVVSVRAPLTRLEGADTLCSLFPTGGGRKGAAGINDLPGDMFDAFLAAFRAAYGGSSG